jgi:hypothetical protein
VKLKDNLWIKWFHLHHLMPFYLLDNVNQWCHDRCLKRFLLPSYPPFSYTLNGQHILIIWLLLYNVAYLGGRCITITIMLQIIRNNWEPMRCIFFRFMNISKQSSHCKSSSLYGRQIMVMVTQYTIVCCSVSIIYITLMKNYFTNITSPRVVQ